MFVGLADLHHNSQEPKLYVGDVSGQSELMTMATHWLVFLSLLMAGTLEDDLNLRSKLVRYTNLSTLMIMNTNKLIFRIGFRMNYLTCLSGMMTMPPRYR
jgi:hypothetical protein